MKIRIQLLFLLIPFYIFSQTNNNQDLKTISGYITHKNKALPYVNVFVENAVRSSVSNAKGFYSIKAKAGETISFSYVGLKTKKIFIEDVTKVLNINLKKGFNDIFISQKKTPKLGDTTIGDHGEDFKFILFEGEKLNKNATSLSSAIVEKIPELSLKVNDFDEELIYIKGKELHGSAIWVIDGVTFDIPFPIFINEVKKIEILNNATDGFVINVKTNINYKNITDINYDDFYFDSRDFYKNDAKSYKKIKPLNYFYLNKYKKIKKEKDALELYLQSYHKEKDSVNFHLNMISFFEKEKLGSGLILKVLSDFEVYSDSNPEDLKTIAYKLQELNEYDKAIAIYKKIIKLRPNHPQSFRDLANAYVEKTDYKNFWHTYRYLLNKRYKIKDYDIDEIIATEMISAYKNDTTKFHKIKIVESLKNINSDVRLVFEWNTTEAEFILEFVNPDEEIYKIENSIEENQNLVTNQKRKGYSSKEVFIKYLNRGNWFVNFTYLGNKHYKPTILKITTYYNWGRKNQTKKIDVFNFTQKDIKAKLLRLSRRFL